jgi:formate hydrogenlyase subunit 4
VRILLGAVALLLHAVLLAAAAPFVLGLVRWLKARLAGRRGPPLAQVWRDLVRLSRKQPVLAESASALTTAAPVVVLATTAAAALLVPSFALGMTTAPAADLLVIAGLMSFGRVALALAAIDAGTAFGGIGASREMAFAALAETALLLVFLTLALLAGGTNLDLIAGLLREGGLGLRVSLGLTLLASLAIAITETGRIPVDNPAGHLELGMVHEAMLLEYSGRHLALLEAASCLRLLVWLTLIAAIFLPFGLAPAGAGLIGWSLGLLAYAAKIVLLTAGLAAFEVSSAKMRVFRVPEFLGVAILLGVLAAVFLFVSIGFA